MSGFNRTPKMTEEECLANDGHCYVEGDEVGLSNPPTHFRRCKHCGKRQQGREQARIDWRDV